MMCFGVGVDWELSSSLMMVVVLMSFLHNSLNFRLSYRLMVNNMMIFKLNNNLF